MLNLLKKDLLASFRADAKTILKLIIGLIIFTVLFRPISTITIPLFVCYVFIFRSFYLDEHNKCDYFFNSMPINKEDVVYSKYIYSTIVIVVSIILAYIYSLIIKANYGFNMLSAETIFYLASMLLTMGAISLPIMFKYGYNKAFLPLNLILVTILTLTTITSARVESAMLNTPNFKPEIVQYYENNQEHIIMVLGCLILYIISMYISKKIYTKKEIAN